MPFTLVGQTIKSYHQIMEKFKTFYNAGQGDSINAMFGSEQHRLNSVRPLWTNEEIFKLLNEFGKLQSFKFIAIDRSDPDNVYVFQTIFSKKGIKATSLTLDKNNKLSTFRFITASNEVSRLLNKSLNPK
jgi:hypothetical protein